MPSCSSIYNDITNFFSLSQFYLGKMMSSFLSAILFIYNDVNIFLVCNDIKILLFYNDVSIFYPYNDLWRHNFIWL